MLVYRHARIHSRLKPEYSLLIITGTPCQYYAAQGVVSGAGTIDLGDNGASISGDGRLVVLEPNPYVVLLE